MFRSKTITVSIHRPLRDVYEFMAEPLNLPTWVASIGNSIAHVSGTDWAADGENGQRIIRFHPRTEHGILDYAVFREGETPVTMPVRVVANGEDGTEVILTLYQRPAVSDAQFNSDAEWIEADLLTLKTLLESRDG
jgi:hypothetical protein